MVQFYKQLSHLSLRVQLKSGWPDDLETVGRDKALHSYFPQPLINYKLPIYLSAPVF